MVAETDASAVRAVLMNLRKQSKNTSNFRVKKQAVGNQIQYKLS